MRSATRIASFLLLAMSFSFTPGWSQDKPFVFRDSKGLPTLAPVMERVTPAVVNIAVVSRSSVDDNPLLRDPFFRRFFGVPDRPPARQRLSAGSGVIVDAEKGYVLTNHHVIANAQEIAVTLKDGRRLAAKLIGSDPKTDIALLKIEANKLTELEFGNSDQLRVGDYVVAIGNPFGLGQTVTSGIVSALGRRGLNLQGYEDFIQTDAPINPGNSGGALITLDGRLVGINTAIVSPAGGNVGIGFSVPINMARAVMQQLIKYGEVRRGRLGVLIQDFTPDLARALGIEHVGGAVITKVEPGTPAKTAGLKPGDVVVSVNGRKIRDSSDLRNRIGLKPAGARVSLTVIRERERKEVSVRLAQARVTARPAEKANARLAGAEFRNLEPGDALYGAVTGVLVTAVDAGSPAARYGLAAGDVILAVNRTPVTNLDQFVRELSAAKGTLALTLQRGETRLFVVVR